MANEKLFGYGNLQNYGQYYIVMAKSIDEATKILQEKIYKAFKQMIFDYKDKAHFDKNGNALNGCADIFLYCDKKGYYDMNDDELFNAFCENEFGKDLFCLELDKKVYKVIALNTNIWRGEWA